MNSLSYEPTPLAGRTTHVEIEGVKFIVSWNGEPADDCEHHHHLGTLGNPNPTAWVDLVQVNGRWWRADEILKEDFIKELCTALLALPEFCGCSHG